MRDLTNSALILAGGSGQRMGQAVPDKTLAPLLGKPVIRYSVEAFLASGSVNHICVVHRDEAQRKALEAALDGLDCGPVAITWTPGGATRQESVLRGLQSLPADRSFVFIHDGARPLIRPVTIASLLMLAQQDGAACLAHRVIDTIKRTPPGNPTAQVALEDLERDRLWAMETPQVFRLPEILEAYRHLAATGTSATDDAAAASALGFTVTLLNNEHPNPKITTPSDLAYAEWLLSQ